MLKLKNLGTILILDSLSPLKKQLNHSRVIKYQINFSNLKLSVLLVSEVPSVHCFELLGNPINHLEAPRPVVLIN